MSPHLLTNFEIEEYYEMSLDSVVFILEIVCLKQ